MKMARINAQEAESIFRGLCRTYKIIAPVAEKGKGAFSGADLLTYGEVGSFGEIEFFKKTHFSAKSVVSPVRETLFEFRKGEVREASQDALPVIIFLRACDINAMAVTDAHFLQGGREDVYYKSHRRCAKFFLMECARPFENCFCVSMGANKTDAYSAFMRKVDGGYEVGVDDEELKKYFPQKGEFEGEPRFAEKDARPLAVPDDIAASIFGHDMWKEYSQRCIACGRCNTSCPTCVCFSIQDVACDKEQGTWRRKRTWSSCQVKNFALLAGNHDFRVSKGDRMRYKVLHKIRDFKKRTGVHMCVGCGRCDDVCPEYISMFRCVEKINEIAARGER